MMAPSCRPQTASAALRKLAALTLCLFAAGCAVGPDYRRPVLPPMDRYTEPLGPGEAAGHVKAFASDQQLLEGLDLPTRWWELFRSPQLDTLMRASLEANPNLTAAQAALRAAQENVRGQQAAYYPNVDIGYAGSRQKITGALASPASSNSSVYNLHTAQVTVGYVPDVFGANSRQVEGLQATADGQRWALEATYLSLSANVAAAAIQEGALREQIDATQRQIALQQDILARWRRLRDLGQATHLDVATQESALAAAESSLPPLARQLGLQRDLLKALAGQMPAQTLTAQFTLGDLTLPAELPLSLPSKLVEHRPDVLAAEAQLRAASAAIGVAAANRLPSVSLGVNAWGSTGYALSDLFRAGTGFWTLAGSVTHTLFDGGALRSREAAARANYEQAAAQYRSTIITAFQNVADALRAIAADGDALRAAQRAQAAADRTLGIARRQLALGDISTLALAQAEQAALQSSIGLIQARAAQLADTVALFQALGGGWWNENQAALSSTSAITPP